MRNVGNERMKVSLSNCPDNQLVRPQRFLLLATTNLYTFKTDFNDLHCDILEQNIKRYVVSNTLCTPSVLLPPSVYQA